MNYQTFLNIEILDHNVFSFHGIRWIHLKIQMEEFHYYCISIASDFTDAFALQHRVEQAIDKNPIWPCQVVLKIRTIPWQEVGI